MLVQKPQVLMDLISKYGIQPGAVARHAARAVETVLLAKQMLTWCDELEAEIGSGIKIHDTDHWNDP